MDTYAARAAAFGARVFVIDGHDLAAIDQALAEAGDLSGHQPSVIVARTRKGRGFSEVEDREGWHGKLLPEHMAERAVVELGGERNLLVRGPRPAAAAPARAAGYGAEIKLPGYERGQKVATRKAYGDALTALGVRPDVVAMDGEVSNSTFADEFAQAYRPHRPGRRPPGRPRDARLRHPRRAPRRLRHRRRPHRRGRPPPARGRMSTGAPPPSLRVRNVRATFVLQLPPLR